MRLETREFDGTEENAREIEAWTMGVVVPRREVEWPIEAGRFRSSLVSYKTDVGVCDKGGIVVCLFVREGHAPICLGFARKDERIRCA